MISRRLLAIGSALGAAALLGAILLLGSWIREPGFGGRAPTSSGTDTAIAAQEWCTSTGTSDPATQALDAGTRWLGMHASNVETARNDPRWSAACDLAFDLWGLTQDQWDWCLRPDVSARYVAPAIRLLGLGVREAAGDDPFSEQPGDDPAELSQACRFADIFWRESSTTADPSSSELEPFLRVSDAARTWCDAHPGALDSARKALELPDSEPGSLPARLSDARACRFASLVAAASSGNVASPSEASSAAMQPMITYEALVVNHSRETVRLVDIGAGQDFSLPIKGCTSLRINGVARPLPWSLGFRVGDSTETVQLVSLGPDADGSHLGYEVDVSADGTARTTRIEPVGPFVGGDLCAE